MALHESTRGCRVIDRSKLSMLTTEFLELRSRRLSSIGKPEVIFDRVDILYQPGTDYERWLDPENCIAPQILVPVQESLPRYLSPSRKRCVTSVRYPGALIMK